jgi:hypothetical protein
MEFMAALRIRRTRFDDLVKFGKIKLIKKCCKIYVQVEEADRYFNHLGIHKDAGLRGIKFWPDIRLRYC